MNIQDLKNPKVLNISDLKNVKYSNENKNLSSALVPASPLSFSNPLTNALKIIPNALGDMYNIAEESTFGTAKNLASIPGEASSLIKESGGVISAGKNLISALPRSAAEVASSMIPKSAKELANVGAIKELPSEFNALVKESGGYSNAIKRIAEAVPQSITPAIKNYINQIDKAGQSVINHPVNEYLGYLALTDLLAGKSPAESIVKKTEAMATKTEAVLKKVPTMEEASIKIAKKLNPDVNKVVNRIVQASKPEDIKTAREALLNVDTRGVKTVADLKSKVSENKKNILSAVDSIAESNPNVYRANELVNVKKVNGVTVKTTPIVYALEHLREFYSKSKDEVKKVETSQFIKKLESIGLNASEVNRIAKNYGNEFGSKAFGKLGEPLTSVSAKAFENTRRGVKEVFRNLFPGDKTLEKLDKHSSNLIKTEKMILNREKKVNSLEARLSQSNIIKKYGTRIGKFIGKGIDALSGGSIKGFISSIFPNNIGSGAMNQLDLQANLSKELKLLDKLENSSGESFVKNLESIVNERRTFKKMSTPSPYLKTKTLLLTAPEIGSPRVSISTPIMLPRRTASAIEKAEIERLSRKK